MRALFIAILIAAVGNTATATEPTCAPSFNQEARKLRSSERINLCDAYAGKPLVVVNTASHCGYTRQFAGLEALYQKYKDRGLEILGVPSNDFQQAAKDEETAARICYVNFGVSFTMLAPQHVRGPNAHPIFKHLSNQAGSPNWNFNKYLLDRNGKVVQRFDSGVEPMSRAMLEAIEASL